MDILHQPSSPGPGAQVPTLPALVERSLGMYRSSAALHERDCGHWRHLGSEEFAAEIRRIALAFNHLGLIHGEGVGLLADSSPHWLAADQAAMVAGGVTVPLFTSMSPEHLLFETERTAVRVLVVIGEVAWTLAKPLLGTWKKVIVRGVPGAAGKGVITWHDALILGDRLSTEDPARFHRLLTRLNPDDPCTIIHTSGSTGSPKGVVLTHRNLVSQITAACERFPLDPGKDRALSALPLAHVFERMVAYTYLVQGAPIWFLDDIKTLGPALREVKPTVLTMVPRLIEKFHARIVRQVESGHVLKRVLGRWAIDLATQRDPATPRNRTLGLADRMVYRSVRGALGGQLKYLIVGGAPLSPELTRFLHAVDLPVYIGYGLTEASPVIAANHPGQRRAGTVGPAWPGVSIRISPEGEILAKGPTIMRGYHRDPAATGQAIDADGWLHTGDLGRLEEDGCLVITGRLKELFKTSGGKYVAPVPIEQALAAACPLVDQAMVVADGRHHVGCLVFPDIEALRAAQDRLGARTDADLMKSPALMVELEKAIAVVNSHLDQWEQIRSWRLVPVQPSIARGEMTPTHKLRRHVLCQTWHRLIDEMYATEPR